LIRRLVDAAAAVQRERTEAGIFRALLDQLSALELETCVCEASDAGFRLVLASHPDGALASALRTRGTSWIEAREVPLGLTWASPQGFHVEDMPSLLAAIAKEPRTRFTQHSELRGVITGILANGVPVYVV